MNVYKANGRLKNNNNDFNDLNTLILLKASHKGDELF